MNAKKDKLMSLKPSITLLVFLFIVNLQSPTSQPKKDNVTEDVFETPWLKRLLELKDIESLDRDIVVEMISEIRVYENRKIKITYNFGNELEHLFSSVYSVESEEKVI